jgi:hypothetical protein
MALPTYPTRLRQIALIAPPSSFHSLHTTLPHILSAAIIHHDPFLTTWGIENFLMPIGGDIIEVCTPLPENWTDSHDDAGRKKRNSTAVGRLLERRGQGGYMIIMQTLNANERRQEIESGRRLPPPTRGDPKPKPQKVIFEHPFEFQYPLPRWTGYGVKDTGFCVQYHPRGIKGGMMPELDSHTAVTANPDPVGERFGPWHALGEDYVTMEKGMKKSGHLWMVGVELRLAEGDTETGSAVQQWSDLFAVSKAQGGLGFTNCKMSFLPGKKGKSEGLESITLALEGKEVLDGITRRAKEAGVWHNEGYFDLCGIKWYVVEKDRDQRKAKI